MDDNPGPDVPSVAPTAPDPWTPASMDIDSRGTNLEALKSKYAGLLDEDRLDIVSIIERLGTPLTIDELTDCVVTEADLDMDHHELETWGDVHELLYWMVLPAFDGRGWINFDSERGIVELPNHAIVFTPRSDHATLGLTSIAEHKV